MEDLEQRDVNDASAIVRSLAPAIEQLLRDYDEDDEVSIGLIERLARSVRERRLVGATLFDALGPDARDALRDMWMYVNQLHRRPVEYSHSCLGEAVAEPAFLNEWSLRELGLLEPGTVIAELTISGVLFRIVSLARCHIEQLVARPKAALAIGDLLCYAAHDVTADLSAQLVALERAA